VIHHGPARIWLTDVMLLLMALIWAVNFSVVKYGTRALSPLAYNAARIILAAVVLVAMAAAMHDQLPSRRDALALVGLGVLGNGCYQLLFVFGIAHSRAGTAALMLAAGPAFVAVISRLRGTERASRRRWAGIALQLAGMACVIFGGARGPAGEDSVLGLVLILSGTLCWSLYTVLLKPYTERVHGIPLAAYTMAGGAVPMALVAAPAMLAAPWRSLPAGVWWAVAYSGIMSLVVAYLFWYRGVRVIGPTRTAMFSNVQPIIALAVAWLALGETPTRWQLLGGALIMTGLLGSRR
jgi:drug/metabolite transporter (DMT)-like permease